MRSPIIPVFVLIAAVTATAGPVADQQTPAAVLEVLKPAGENLLKPDAWRPYAQGFQRQGDIFVCDNGTDGRARRGACQTVTLNQTVAQPIFASAWSRAEAVAGEPNADYSLYLDLVYVDGEPLYGQVGTFRTGTHDWQRTEVTVFPVKPVRRLTVYLLLRQHAGKAYFRDVHLSVAPTPAGTTRFDGLAVRALRPVAGGVLVRDVAAESNFVAPAGGKALGLAFQTQESTAAGAKLIDLRITETTGSDRAVTVVYTVSAPGSGWRWLAGPRRDVPAEPPNDYQQSIRIGNIGSRGQLSLYPFAAIAKQGRGMALGIDMSKPAMFRAGYCPAAELMYVAFDIGLAPERNAADLRVVQWQFDGTAGFRGAVARLYEIFPDQFRCRTPKMGLWMPFFRISKVRGWEDFCFKFKEGNDETEWDDDHGILTFRYTEPMTWWMRMPKELPRTLDAALAEAHRLAQMKNPSALALLSSGFHDEAGRFTARLRNEPWCDGAVWSMNSMPNIADEVTDFGNKWNPALRERLYGPARQGDLDGEYIDSTEGYATDLLDFRRDHFAAARTPLAFAGDSRRPAIFRGMVAFEYAKAIADDVHSMDKLMMCNGVPNRFCWLAPLFDVLGTETDWNPGGRWRPMADDDLMYRRVLCGPKPYCFLMNTEFEAFPYDRVERYMKRCLAYGMFPGFFSHNASEKHYFSRPELYDRDRPLFKKYLPLVKRVAEAGWEPLTGAASSDPSVHVERFGLRYLTVLNDSAEPKTATVTLNRDPPPRCRELVTGAEVTWTDRRATLSLGPEDVALLDLAP